jgi:HEAT repeat protein
MRKTHNQVSIELAWLSEVHQASKDEIVIFAPHLRTNMIESTRFATASILTVSPTKTALEIALEALTDGDFRERWEAAKLFSALSLEAIVALLDLLETEEDDWELCWFIARILGQSDRPEAIAALIDLLDRTDNEEVKVIAATTLANFGQRAIEPLTRLLKEPQWRRLAIQALSLTNHSEAIEPLLSIVNDPDPKVRAAALSALQSFRDPRVLPLFVTALEDFSTAVRREATIGLGLRATEEMAARSQNLEHLDLVKLLEQRLYDVDFSICQQAAIALSRCGTDTAALALFRVMQAPHTPFLLQVEIVRSLSWIDSLLVLEYLRQSLNLKSPIVCLEGIRALGQVSQPQYQSIAAQLLLDWWRSTPSALQHSEIRQTLALELGRLGNPQALPYLQTLKNDPDAKVRIHAETAYKKLI